jgi:WXG100 family type VII secretion target
MSVIGGELEQLTTLKATFDKHAGGVMEMVSSIDSQLANTYWKGQAADRFRSMWSSDFKRSLTALEQALQEAGAEVMRRRDALREAGS